jgi:hypothetical protein
MIHLNDAPEAPEWSVQVKTCRICRDEWHAICPAPDMPANVVLGDN